MDRRKSTTVAATEKARARQRKQIRIGTAAVACFFMLGLFLIALFQAQLVANQKTLDQTRSEIAQAEKEQARLRQAVDESSSPISIVQRAQDLGMVRAVEPVYLAAVSPAPKVPNNVLSPPEDASLIAASDPGSSSPTEPGPPSGSSPLAGSTAVAPGAGDE